MLSARQLLLMRRVRDRSIGVAIAPIGTVALLPNPGLRRRVVRCVSHVGLGLMPYVGGGFGHFYAYAPVKIKYAINRFAMEVKRLLDDLAVTVVE
jgi:hypothetical protein